MKTNIATTGALYSTTDLTTAVTLSLFFPIVDIDRTNPKRATFFFKQSPDFNKTLDLYWQRKLSIEPQAFATQIKTIKTRLYWEK